MVQAGADRKSVLVPMRHSRIGPTMDIYAQFVPESQRSAVVQMIGKSAVIQLKLNWYEMECDCVLEGL
jgi:hypothetical protein